MMQLEKLLSCITSDETCRLAAVPERPLDILRPLPLAWAAFLRALSLRVHEARGCEDDGLSDQYRHPFPPDHPRHETHIQNYLERRGANDYSVAFNSSVSENQPLEDSVRAGHPQTDSMQNDLALLCVESYREWP
jgi:hypothetical protein